MLRSEWLNDLSSLLAGKTASFKESSKCHRYHTVENPGVVPGEAKACRSILEV